MLHITKIRNRHSSKYLLLVVVVGLVVAVGVFIYRQFQLDPSPAMVAMTAFDKKINLPKPSAKKVLYNSCPTIKFFADDSCTTHIQYYYSNKDAEKYNIENIINNLTAKLMSDNWYKEDVGSSGTTTLYGSSDEKVCLQISKPSKQPVIEGYMLTIIPYGGLNGIYCQERT